MDKPILTTQRLKIRNLKESDLDAFFQYRSNPDVTKYQGFDTFSREQALEFINIHKDKTLGSPGEWIQYAIETVHGHQLVGDCAIHLQMDDPLIAELGITISDLHHRKGYAKEAMLGLMDFLFREKKIHRILETVDSENIASIKMMKSLFFRQEGHSKENIFFKGKWGSEIKFSMLFSEWDQLIH